MWQERPGPALCTDTDDRLLHADLMSLERYWCDFSHGNQRELFWHNSRFLTSLWTDNRFRS